MKTIYIAELQDGDGVWSRSSNASAEFATLEAARQRVNSHGARSAKYRIVKVKEIRAVVGKHFHPK